MNHALYVRARVKCARTRARPARRSAVQCNVRVRVRVHAWPAAPPGTVRRHTSIECEVSPPRSRSMRSSLLQARFLLRFFAVIKLSSIINKKYYPAILDHQQEVFSSYPRSSTRSILQLSSIINKKSSPAILDHQHLKTLRLS